MCVCVCVRACVRACVPHTSVIVDQSMDVWYPTNMLTARKHTAVIAFLIGKDINIRSRYSDSRTMSLVFWSSGFHMNCTTKHAVRFVSWLDIYSAKT